MLGVGDVVGINVWDQKELNTDATIRPDGTITMPLVGDMKAAGETPTELREKIKTSLAAFVKMGSAGNEVTVAVRSWKSYRFTIEGEVTKAGVFTADQYVTVAEALAMAGGLSRFAQSRRDSRAAPRREGQHPPDPARLRCDRVGQAPGHEYLGAAGRLDLRAVTRPARVAT